jgi:hypothetical protein
MFFYLKVKVKGEKREKKSSKAPLKRPLERQSLVYMGLFSQKVRLKGKVGKKKKRPAESYYLGF